MKMRLFYIALALVLTGLISCGQRTEKTEEKAGLQGVIIVASKSGNDVYFIDRETGETLVVLPTGLEPHEVEVSDDGRIAVVCNYGDRENPGNTLTVFDVQKGEYHKTIDLGEHTRPHGMQWIAGTNNLLVTTEGSQSLLIVDVKEGEVIKVMDTGEPVSHMVAATPDFSRAFVPSIRTGNMVVFDLETGEMIDIVYSGAGAEGIDVSPDGREVWVTNRADNTITIFDTQTLEVLAQLPCEDFPIRAKFTPDGSRFLVSNARSGNIAVFDAVNKLHMADIKLTPPVPADTDAERYFAEFEGTSIPIGLVIPDNRFAYVANTRSDVVSVIDIKKLEITGHFQAGREPDGINFSHLKPE
jgi:YVTN family beta-propeller protein